jgi:hypothetical protein
MSVKRRAASTSEIQIRNWQKTISIEAKLDVIKPSQKKMEKLLTYAVM